MCENPLSTFQATEFLSQDLTANTRCFNWQLCRTFNRLGSSMWLEGRGQGAPQTEGGEFWLPEGRPLVISAFGESVLLMITKLRAIMHLLKQRKDMQRGVTQRKLPPRAELGVLIPQLPCSLSAIKSPAKIDKREEKERPCKGALFHLRDRLR